MTDKTVFGCPADVILRQITNLPEDCKWALFRTIALKHGEPFADELWMVQEDGQWQISDVQAASEEELGRADLGNRQYINLTELFGSAKAHFNGPVIIIAALFWDGGDNNVWCSLIAGQKTSGFTADYTKVIKKLGGPPQLLPQPPNPSISMGARISVAAGRQDTPSELQAVLDQESVQAQTYILTPSSLSELLDKARGWSPIQHLRDAERRLLSGGFVGMPEEVLSALTEAVGADAPGAVDDAKAVQTRIMSLADVKTEGRSSWLDLWLSWRSVERGRVEIVENSEWKQMLRSVMKSCKIADDQIDEALLHRQGDPFGPSQIPDEAHLVEAEIRYLLTQLFRPEADNRRVMMEIVQIMTDGRSGAITFLAQPRLSIFPEAGDATAGVDSRVGRVAVVKLDDVGIIAREYAGFTDVVDRYLYSYATRISRVAKAHRFGALAYASIGGLDDYAIDIAGTVGPISLREFISEPYRRRGMRETDIQMATNDDVQRTVTALDRCVFSDLHQDSRSGVLEFDHYSDVLPADFVLENGRVRYIGRGVSDISFEPWRMDYDSTTGGCAGRVISVGRSSLYVQGDVAKRKEPVAPGSDWRTEDAWTRPSTEDPTIGPKRAIIEIRQEKAGQLVGVLLGMVKHVQPAVVPTLQVVAHGIPRLQPRDVGSEAINAMLSGDECLLPWRLLGLLRNDRADIPARIGSTHGDLNLTNLLVTFIKKEDRQEHPRCWLIDYGMTRLDGHTGRDYAQLEMGIRREVLAPTYMDICRRLTKTGLTTDREQARRLVLAYHKAFEEQLVRHDTAPPEFGTMDAEFETVALADSVLHIVDKLGEHTANMTRRIQEWDSAGPSAGNLLRLDIRGGSDHYARTIFVYLSSDPGIRRCYYLLRMLRGLALDHRHDRLEQMWAQMLIGLSAFRQQARTNDRLGSLEFEITFLSTVVAAEEIHWNLGSAEREALAVAVEDSSADEADEPLGDMQTITDTASAEPSAMTKDEALTQNGETGRGEPE